eukprot:7752842-Pyramimonas_sp.AAC.1
MPEDTNASGPMSKSAPMIVGRDACSATVPTRARGSTLASESPIARAHAGAANARWTPARSVNDGPGRAMHINSRPPWGCMAAERASFQDPHPRRRAAP